MDYVQMGPEDYAPFHELACAYYREGEDADTPQEEMDAFIASLFEMVRSHEIEGCFARIGEKTIGFALWAVDAEGFRFSEMPGFGTILEIGLAKDYRASGLGKAFVAHIERAFLEKDITRCYVSAYGPAQTFWARCGYRENGKKASNGLPMMVKELH